MPCSATSRTCRTGTVDPPTCSEQSAGKARSHRQEVERQRDRQGDRDRERRERDKETDRERRERDKETPAVNKALAKPDRTDRG